MALPPVGQASDLMIGTIYINYKKQGWSEKYILGNVGGDSPTPPTYPTAVSQMVDAVKYRKCILGSACNIVWARVSKQSIRGDSAAVIDGPVVPINLNGEVGDVPEPINDPRTGPLFRFEDGLGAYSQRIFRGIRDSWVSDFELGSTLFPTAPTHGNTFTAVVAGTITAVQALKNWILWLIQNTVQAKLIQNSPKLWKITSHEVAKFRYMAARDIGRPFAMSHGRAPSRV